MDSEDIEILNFRKYLRTLLDSDPLVSGSTLSGLSERLQQTDAPLRLYNAKSMERGNKLLIEKGDMTYVKESKNQITDAIREVYNEWLRENFNTTLKDTTI